MLHLPPLSLAILISSYAHAVIIDDFRSGALWLETATYSPETLQVQSGLDPTTVVSGTRSVSIRAYDEPSSVTIDPTAGILTFTPTATETSHSLGYLQLVYGSPSPLNLDLLATGDTAIAIRFAGLPPRTVAGIALESFSPSGQTQSGWYQFTLADEQQSLVVVPFSKFAAVDLRSVDRIIFDTGRVTREFRLDAIYTVPEPSVALISAMAATLSISSSRRTRRCL